MAVPKTLLTWLVLVAHLLGLGGSRLLPDSMRLAQAPVLPSSCPCADASLCKTPLAYPEREFFGFGGNGWPNFDWDQVTTVAWAQDPEIICQAHRVGARIIAAAPDLVFSSDPMERRPWIDRLIASLQASFYDGVTFDYELPLDNSPGSATFEQMRQYVALVNETRVALHAAIPGSQISVCVAWSPDDIDGRNYNYPALASASDLLYIMAYDMRSQVYGRCIASANSPLSMVEYGVRRYMQLGISPRKLVLGTPWYGYQYPCTNVGVADDFCQIDLVPFRGVNCSDAAGTEVAFKDIMDLFDRGRCPPDLGSECQVTTALRRDASTQSPYFNFLVDGRLHQMWFDDATSSVLKYGAARNLGLRGIGPFTWDDLDTNGSATGNPQAPAEAKSMWDALKAFSYGDHWHREDIVV